MEDSWQGFHDYNKEGEETLEPEENEDRISLQNNCRIKYFSAAMFATILEDSIMELRILAECNNELRIIKAMSDMELLRAGKYSVAQPLVKDELDGINVRELGCMQYKLDKLAADRKYISDALIATYLNVSVQRSYDAMVERINKIVERDDRIAFLVEDEAKNKITRRELMKQLRQQRNHCKSANYDTDINIDQLKSSVEDANLNAETQTRYVDNWQRARTEQHNQTITDEEATPAEVIRYYRQRADHEHRVHSEIETVNGILINETLEKVESWMNKYDKDMEGLDLKIQIMKNDYQNTYDRRIAMEDQLEKHGKEMGDWVHFKDERQKARDYRDKMNKAAIAVQSWWRGLLVRLQLGPYKPTKKKGAAPAGKKKK